MVKINEIIDEFKVRRIHEYRIIIREELQFKYQLDNSLESIDLIKDMKFHIIFNSIKGLSFATINSDKDNISELIGIAIENTNQIKWENQNIFNNDIITNLDESYLLHEEIKGKYTNWLRSEKKEIEDKIYLNGFNMAYFLKLYKDTLLENDTFIHQFHKSSEIVLMDKSAKGKFNYIKNLYDNESIVNKIQGDKSSKYVITNEVLKGKIYLKRTVVKIILNVLIKGFYGDLMISNQSFIKPTDINIKNYKNKLDLINIPYEGTYFDADGIIYNRKSLIENGLVRDSLNTIQSGYFLGTNSKGNGSFDENGNIKISHNRLIFNIDNLSDKNDVSMIFDDFKISNVNLKSGQLYGVLHGGKYVS